MNHRYELYVRYYDDEAWVLVTSGVCGTDIVSRAQKMAKLCPGATLVLLCGEQHCSRCPWRYDRSWVVYYSQGSIRSSSQLNTELNESVLAMVFGPTGVIQNG